MTELQDPTHLTEVQRYKQLTQIFQGNNKLKNPNWFAHPTEMPLQLHLISRTASGKSFDCFVYNAATDSWQNYPSQPIATLSSKLRLEEIIGKIMADAGNQKDNGLGVIFHSDDDLATTEIPLDGGLPKNLEALNQSLIFDPTTTLQDESLAASEYVWRMLPYLTAESPPYATALVMSRQFDAIAENLLIIGQEMDLPIRVTILSSPLTTIQALPYLFTPTEDRATAFLIPFDSLTVFGVLDSQGELRLVRSLQGRINPSLIVHSIRTTMLSLEMSEFDIISIFPEQQNQMLQRALTKNFTQHQVTAVNGTDLLPDAIREQVPFVIAAATRQLSLQSTRLQENQSFSLLKKRHWGLPNFCDPAAKVIGFEPSQEEIKLARLGAKLRPIMLISTVAIALLAGLWIFISMTSDEWNFRPTESTAISKKVKNLKAANLEHDRVETLLLDRSRAWTNLEFFAQLIPKGKGIYVDRVTYSATPTLQATNGTAFSRKWRITGYYDDRMAGNNLAKLSSLDYLQKRFNEIHSLTGDESFDLSRSTRSLSQPRLSDQENQRANGPARNELGIVNPSNLPRTFQLDIEQTFTPSDPLALPKLSK